MDQQLQEEWESNLEILSQKHQEYTDRWQDLSVDLPEHTEELKLNALLSLDEKVHQMWIELNTKEDKLKAYQDLPPDFNLASLKLEEKKAEWVIHFIYSVSV